MAAKFRSIRDMFNLEGKKALITGGGSGIGRAIALGFAEYGVDVALMGRTEERLKNVRGEIKDRFKVDAFVVPGDVLDPRQVENSVTKAISHLGRIDILVNSHGIGQWVKAEDLKEEDWDKMIGINLKGVFMMCQAVGRHMIKNRYGKIVNIASISGVIANKPQAQAHYNAAKAGVLTLTKCLASEWAKYNVTVNCISPGYTLTPMLERRFKTNPELEEFWRSNIPMNRIADPFEMAGAAVFLASEASSYVTGANIIIDGGYTIW
jgi:NAD(P)-dependent dehydrogenase (short-subunit alcohol dehydrogenase family)